MSTITITFAVRESKARTSGEAPIDYNLFMTIQHFSKSAKTYCKISFGTK